MSYHELLRLELETRCKEYGLPANKFNAVMASSLTSFLGVLPAAKKSIKARTLPKTERLETSLASLILEATESRAKLLKAKSKEFYSEGRKLPVGAHLSAFSVSSHAKDVESVPQLKTAPLPRRRKNDDAAHSTVVSANPDEYLSPLHEEIPMQASGIVVKLGTPEPQLAPVLDAAVFGKGDEGPIELEPIASPSATVLHDQGCQNKNKRCCEEHVHASLSPLVFRITVNVDKLIRQTTTFLRTFDEWKVIDKLSTTLETH